MEIKTFSPKNHKIKALIYGKSWVWKTTFAGTAEKVLFASAENWLLSVADKNVAYTEIKSLNDLIEVRDFLKKWDHDFETFVIDSITEISDIIKSEIEKKTWRLMQIQDWWELSNKIEKIIKDIKEIDINVIVIAQELIDKDSDKIERIVPSLNGKSSTKIAYYMDEVWYLFVDKHWNRKMFIWSSDRLLTKDRAWVFGDYAPLNFPEWLESIRGMLLHEEKVLFKTMSPEEAKIENQKKVFGGFYNELKGCKTLKDLQVTFTKINKNKKNITIAQHKELSSLKDDMKQSLEAKEKPKELSYFKKLCEDIKKSNTIDDLKTCYDKFVVDCRGDSSIVSKEEKETILALKNEAKERISNASKTKWSYKTKKG